MIRKIFVGAFLIYLATWMFVSYFLESKLKENLDVYSDLSIEYSEIKTTGFPSGWEFEIISPIIKSNDQSSVFKTENINVKISLTFKKFTLSMGNIANISFIPEDIEEPTIYDIVFNENPNIVIKLKSADFKDNNLIINLRNIIISPFSMIVSSNDEKVMEINNKLASISNLRDQDFVLEYDVLCDANSDVLGFSNLAISLFSEVSFMTQKENSSIILSSIKSKTFEIKLDDESTLDFSGRMNFNQDQIPQGKFVLNLYNYNKLVDVLWPLSSGFSASEVKSIIEKCNINDNDGNAYLPIEFSDEGLNIGQETWQALQGE